MAKVKVIGGGLAGVEAANYLANHGIEVEIIDIKPHKFTPAHSNQNYAELVCSNSLKSSDVYGNAAGLLKEEMRYLGSIMVEAADQTKVPAGGALAVDRERFAEYITDKLKSNPLITHVSSEVEEIDFNGDEYVIVATGPLTTDKLSQNIKAALGDGMYFFDASAPIIDFESIDMENAFFGDRYDKGTGDHINCPMTKEEYLAFLEELLNAKRADLHGFEKDSVFEGCMPVEVMAARGTDTLRFGPLKPVGLTNPKTGRWAYACLQLRKEDKEGKMYNMVGFQTNLLFPEQKRVFSMIPALKNAEFLRYGVMHRNTFINSPSVLNKDYSLKSNGKIFFAGQITGVEGYVESAASGLMSAIYCERKINNKDSVYISEKTVLGSLAKHITTPNKDFQPMNANFGIIPTLDRVIRDKKERKKEMAIRSLECVKEFIKEIEL